MSSESEGLGWYPSHLPSQTSLSGNSVARIERIAGIAASGAPVEERTEEVLDEIHYVFPFDAAILSCLDAVTAVGRPVVIRGYPSKYVEYLVSPEWQAECVGPFGVPGAGWPVREHDLPIDPQSLRGIAKGRAVGLNEGLLGALITPEGRHTGFIMLSWSDTEPPSDETCAVIGHTSLALANMVDPLQSARVLAASLDKDSTAVGLRPDGSFVTLRGTPEDALVEPGSSLRPIVRQFLAGWRTTMAFLWPRSDAGWYLCRVFRCRDNITLLTLRPFDEPYGLTRRELEVLTSLADGRSNSEIASQLWVTTRTVRAHVEHIFGKLGTTTRSAAVAHAVAEGLLLPRQAADLLD